MTNITQLRARWKTSIDEAFMDDVSKFLQTGSHDVALDLRGAMIGMDGPLADFQLREKSFFGLDISFGRGCLIVSNAAIQGMEAMKFQFDRASYFKNSNLVDCSFVKSRGRFNALSTKFRNCRFDQSGFKGGFNEYGFRRCHFHDCSFVGIDWRNSYFRACEFYNCDFTHAQIATSIIAGMKFFGFYEWQSLFSDCTISSVYVDGEKVHPLE